ncbi:MAG: tripartite tricarboxylate transporter substrate binding protein [Rhizobiales bacterium]|nr:tripartite tricarboxylate transporter substrate binding protein [Hyphomicrobiales bacterium]
MDRTSRPDRRRFIGSTTAAALALAAPRLARAQTYPSRPVRVIIPFTPGGAPDVLLRLVAQKLTEKWGQSVIVENRAGGNTLTGTIAVTKGPTDGYTLLLTGDQTFILNPLLYPTLPYSMKELDPIILIASIPHMLAVSRKLPVSNVKELIALAKREPDTLTFGTTGAGTIQRIATEYFAGIAGIKLVHVPYRGANETTTAILSGEIDLTINGMSNILPHIEGGKLKALAISTLSRHPLAPDVPTMQEAGVPDYRSQGAFGLFAPVGVPADIRAKIHADTAEVLQRPDVVKALQDRSFQVDNVGPDGFTKMIAAETEKWAKVIRAANIKGD